MTEQTEITYSQNNEIINVTASSNTRQNPVSVNGDVGEHWANVSKQYALEAEQSALLATEMKNLTVDNPDVSVVASDLLSDDTIGAVASNIDSVTLTGANIDNINICANNITVISQAEQNALLAQIMAETAEHQAQIATAEAQTSATSATVATEHAQVATQKAEDATAAANTAQTCAETATEQADDAKIWAEGTDQEVEALGGVHSAKTWAMDYSEKANKSLSNLSEEGEAHFVNPDLANLSTTGMGVLNAKANTSLSNLANAGRNQAAWLALPGGKYVELTLGATGSKYTAPADGYFVLVKAATGHAQFIHMSTSANIQSIVYAGQAGGLATFVPTSKNTTLNIAYSLAGATTYFRFVKANAYNNQ